MSWFYISFARPKSEGGFLGATVVEADDGLDALYEATARKLNPGGHAQIIEVAREKWEHPDIVACRYRLVGKAELFASKEGARRGYHERGAVVCQDCNEGDDT